MAEDSSSERLITRGDFDGIVCGSLLIEQGLVSEVVFVHPREIQSGEFVITPDDVIANLPYSEQAHLCFAHHENISFQGGDHDNLIIDKNALSSARTIYNYYDGAKTFPEISKSMLDAIDKAVSADYSIEEILIPENWMLLNFVLDPHTGLEGFKDFEIPRMDFLTDLIAFCKRSPIEEILSHPDVEERVTTFIFHTEFAELQNTRCAQIHDKTVVIDFRNEEKRYPANRFLVYGLFSQCNLSIELTKTSESGMTEIAVGKSIIDRSSNINVGDLMFKYGGGGHTAAGTCRIENEKVDNALSEILEACKNSA